MTAVQIPTTEIELIYILLILHDSTFWKNINAFHGRLRTCILQYNLLFWMKYIQAKLQKNFQNILFGELFVVKMMGSGGESMYHKTFGNMIHPSGLWSILNRLVS